MPMVRYIYPKQGNTSSDSRMIERYSRTYLAKKRLDIGKSIVVQVCMLREHHVSAGLQISCHLIIQSVFETRAPLVI